MGDAIPIRAWGEVAGYGTPGEAIRAAARHPKQGRAQDATVALEGRRLVSADCDLERWAVEFSGQAWLHVFVGADGVRWEIRGDAPDFEPISRPAVFEWPDGGASTMDARALSERRRGAGFRRLRVNEGGLLLYLEGRPILWFHAVERRDTGEALLFACDDDG